MPPLDGARSRSGAIYRAVFQHDVFMFTMRYQLDITMPDALMAVTGMTKTELAYFALHKEADAYLPLYAEDNGPLTPAQIQAIHEISTASSKSEERFNKSLL